MIKHLIIILQWIIFTICIPSMAFSQHVFEPGQVAGFYESEDDGTVIEITGGEVSQEGLTKGKYTYIVNYMYGGSLERCLKNGYILTIITFDIQKTLQTDSRSRGDVYTTDVCNYRLHDCNAPHNAGEFEFRFQKVESSDDSYYTRLVFQDYEYESPFTNKQKYERYVRSKVFWKTKSINYTQQWSGSGWALGSGYLVTNYHVVDGARAIAVKGIRGDLNTSYSAEVVATDKTNDIAVLKIKDSRFKGFGTIPYSVSSRIADKGEGIFVLGYPMTQVLGNEVKYTAGEINSRTGFQGDVATYQISAPVTHGNSGGPMFDNRGNVIGIVNSGITDKEIAENVGYAIKISYLKILIESAGLNITLPQNNTIANLSKQEKIKKVEKFVYYIECSK
jgi:hypothetical protein